MSVFVAEQIRSSHGLIEQLQDTCTTHLIKAADTALAPLDRLAHEHEAKRLIEEMKRQMQHTLALYTDDSSLMTQQLAAIEGDSTWTSFYDTLATLRLQANKLPPPIAPPPASHVAATALPPFTVEESNGRHVDLHAQHVRYLELPFHPRVDYLTFLQTFTVFHTVSRERKAKSFHSAAYAAYITQLAAYWRQFGQRLYPLVEWEGGVDSESVEGEMKREFEIEWRERRVKGWFENDGDSGGTQHLDGHPAKADAQKAAREESKEQVRSIVKQDPLYCRACKKQFAKQTVFDAHLKGRKHVKAQQEMDALSSASSSFSPTASAAPTLPASVAAHVQQMHDIALIEYCIQQYAQLMDTQLQATIAFQQHKLTLTPAELQQEIQHTLQSTTQPASTALILSSTAAANHGSPMDEDDLPPSLANPKHLPLGPDGKPIPYWVYKLQGLNQWFECEVCGDYKYRGPREYTEHFSGWRHAWGMKCIGVPNARELWGVVRIEEVKALWERMRLQEAGKGWKEEEEEEMEDSEGNVFNKKTFLELQRQGLI